MIAGGFSQSSAATLGAVAKSLACQKLQEDLAKIHFRVEFVCPFCPTSGQPKGILPDRVIFVFSSCDHWCYWAFFASRRQYGGTRSCLVVVGRQDGNVKYVLNEDPLEARSTSKKRK